MFGTHHYTQLLIVLLDLMEHEQPFDLHKISIKAVHAMDVIVLIFPLLILAQMLEPSLCKVRLCLVIQDAL